MPWPRAAALTDAGTRSFGFATDPRGDHSGCISTAVHDSSPFRTYNRKVFSTKCGTGWLPMSLPGHFSGSHGHKNACVHPCACSNTCNDRSCIETHTELEGQGVWEATRNQTQAVHRAARAMSGLRGGAVAHHGWYRGHALPMCESNGHGPSLQLCEHGQCQPGGQHRGCRAVKRRALPMSYRERQGRQPQRLDGDDRSVCHLQHA